MSREMFNKGAEAYNPDDETTRGARVQQPQSAMSFQQQLFNQQTEIEKGFFDQKAEYVDPSSGAGVGVGKGGVDVAIKASGRGGYWEAKQKPNHEFFRYRATSIHFNAGVKLVDITNTIYSFIDRQYTVDLRKAVPEKGTFALAVFVGTQLVNIKLRLWSEVESQSLVNSGNLYILEVELREGDPLSFGAVYRTLRSSFVQLSDGAKQECMEMEQADKDDDVFMISPEMLEMNGLTLDLPDNSDWDAMLNDVSDVKNFMMHASNVEALSSIAQTYEPSDLEYVCAQVCERKIGFEDLVADDNMGTPMTNNTYLACSDSAKYQSLWAMCALINHLAQHQDNLKSLVKLMPTLHTCLMKISKEESDDSSIWFSVVECITSTLLNLAQLATKFDSSIVEGMSKFSELSSMNKITLPKDSCEKVNAGLVYANSQQSKSYAARLKLDQTYQLLNL